MQISPSPSPVSPPISPPDHITHEVQGSFIQWAPLFLIVLAVFLGIVDLKVNIDAHDQEQTQVALQRRRLQRPSALPQPQPSPTVPPSEMISSIICTYRIENPEAAAAAVAVESGGDCAICMEDYKYGDECRMFVSCNHGFHRACVDEWLVRNRHCPLCRGSVTGLRSVNLDDQV